jgi:hypothetical protein
MSLLGTLTLCLGGAGVMKLPKDQVPVSAVRLSSWGQTQPWAYMWYSVLQNE